MCLHSVPSLLCSCCLSSSRSLWWRGGHVAQILPIVLGDTWSCSSFSRVHALHLCFTSKMCKFCNVFLISFFVCVPCPLPGLSIVKRALLGSGSTRWHLKLLLNSRPPVSTFFKAFYNLCSNFVITIVYNVMYWYTRVFGGGFSYWMED